jgi:putative redox protein
MQRLERLPEVMKTRVQWLNGVSFVGESGSGHSVVADGAPDAGGRNIGMRPMEMLLTGAAACTAFDVVTILQKGRHPVADVAVAVEAERAADAPRVFTKLHYVYTVAGRGLDPKHVERAVKLSKEKYCSATIMLAKTAAVTYEIRMIEGDRVPEPTATGG